MQVLRLIFATSIFISSTAFAETLNSQYFGGKAVNQVVQNEFTDESLLTVQTVLENCSGCDKPTIKKKLDLYTKLNLLRYLNTGKKLPYSFELSGLKKQEDGYLQGKPYSISVINMKNIKKLDDAQLKKAQGKSAQDLTDKLAYYESMADKQPNSESAWQGLYDTYSKMGELDKANQAMDKLMQLKMSFE